MCHIYLELLDCTHLFQSPVHHCLQTESVVALDQMHQALVNVVRFCWIILHSSFFGITAKVDHDTLGCRNTCSKRVAFEQTSGAKPVNKVTMEGLYTEQSSSVHSAKHLWVLNSISQKTQLREMSGTVSCFCAAIRPRVSAHILFPI